MVLFKLLLTALLSLVVTYLMSSFIQWDWFWPVNATNDERAGFIALSVAGTGILTMYFTAMREGR